MEAYKWKLRNIFIIHHHQKKYVIREHFLFSAIVLAAQMPGLCPWRYLFIFLSRVFTYVRSLSYCGECGLSVLFVSYICRLFYLFSLFLVFWFWWWGQWDIRRPAKEAFFIKFIIHAHYTRNKNKVTQGHIPTERCVAVSDNVAYTYLVRIYFVCCIWIILKYSLMFMICNVRIFCSEILIYFLPCFFYFILY